MNSRLTVAAHILAMVAHHEREDGRATTSDELAESIGTNPVVVRRVLAQLHHAGLVTCRRGVGGGTVLARDARVITLREVYEAVEKPEAEILGRHAGPVGHTCEVAPVIAEYLDEIYAEAEEAMLAKLGRVTVESMRKDVLERVGRRAAAGRRAHR